ncbi:MAG TPA: hypothetical protein GXX39_05950 [Syntrophothermus lipocalidus]|nr:hypothetical protein [Syntrophothermus lipocalidus]
MAPIRRFGVLVKGRDKRPTTMTDDNSVETVMARQKEIDRLRLTLQEFGLDYDLLIKESPQNWAVLEAVKEAAFRLSEQIQLLSTVLISDVSQFESWLAQRVDLPLPYVRRHGHYLVAISLIVAHDLRHLLPYILPVKRRNTYGCN